MKFRHDWIMKYAAFQAEDYPDVLEYLKNSVLEAEVHGPYVHCSVPYGREDLKYIHGTMRMCYEVIKKEAYSPSPILSKTVTEGYWKPTNMTACCIGLLEKEVIGSWLRNLDSGQQAEITDVLQQNKIEVTLPSWVKFVFGADLTFFSIKEFVQIDNLVLDPQNPYLEQGGSIVNGVKNYPDEASQVLMVMHNALEDLVIQDLQFIFPLCLKACQLTLKETRKITLDKNKTKAKLGFELNYDTMKMYLESEDGPLSTYSIPSYLAHIKGELELVEELAVRSVKELKAYVEV